MGIASNAVGDVSLNTHFFSLISFSAITPIDGQNTVATKRENRKVRRVLYDLFLATRLTAEQTSN
jgi:hypothetical protein